MNKDCFVSGHYYKIDTEQNTVNINKTGATFYVICQRCGDRILINDKTYEARKRGECNL